VFAIEPGLLFVLLQERFASAAPARLLRGLTLDKSIRPETGICGK
jgi:hypothetical protein